MSLATRPPQPRLSASGVASMALSVLRRTHPPRIRPADLHRPVRGTACTAGTAGMASTSMHTWRRVCSRRSWSDWREGGSEGREAGREGGGAPHTASAVAYEPATVPERAECIVKCTTFVILAILNTIARGPAVVMAAQPLTMILGMPVTVATVRSPASPISSMIPVILPVASCAWMSGQVHRSGGGCIPSATRKL